MLFQQPPDCQHVAGRADKGGGNKIYALLDAKNNILPVPESHGGKRNNGSRQINPLAVPDCAAVYYPANDISFCHFFNCQLYEPVIQKNWMTGGNVPGQAGVGNRNYLAIALNLPSGQGKLLAGLKLGAAAGKGAQANLRTLGIQENCHRSASLFRRLADCVNAAAVFLPAAMGKIETGHIHARQHHLFKSFRTFAGRSNGAHNLGLSHFFASYIDKILASLNASMSKDDCCARADVISTLV